MLRKDSCEKEDRLRIRAGGFGGWSMVDVGDYEVVTVFNAIYCRRTSRQISYVVWSWRSPPLSHMVIIVTSMGQFVWIGRAWQNEVEWRKLEVAMVYL